jgi:sn-glycerol 3-phosphate transport system permease protein
VTRQAVRGIRTTAWALAVGAFAFVWVFPLLWAVATSFRPPGSLGSQIASLWVHHPSLANFREAWSEAPFVRLYYNTAVVVFGILGAQLVTITLAAYAFARMEFPGRELLFRLFLLQLMVAPSSLILAIDGCTTFQTLWHVFLPLARPTLIAFSIVSVVYHYNEFLWPLIITDTDRARTVTVGLASFTQSAESAAQWNLIAAGTVIVILPLLVLFILFQRRFVESFMFSGLKG